MSQGKCAHQTINDGSLYAPFALIIYLDSGVKAFWQRYPFLSDSMYST